jgi:hypothetical protein
MDCNEVYVEVANRGVAKFGRTPGTRAPIVTCRRSCNNTTGAPCTAGGNDVDLAGSQNRKKDQPMRTKLLVRVISDSFTGRPSDLAGTAKRD